MRTLIGITGTTAVGKSAVAIKLAQTLGSEIISADSMQIYRGMDIGTAKVKPSETLGIKHYMIDIVNPNENYSSFLYQADASAIIDKLTCIPIVVGGTGFYFDSLLYPPEFGKCSAENKAQIATLYSEKGLDGLVELLKNVDIDTYDNIDLSNPKRVIRALEIACSGTNKSDGKGRQKPKYNLILFVLQRNRTELYKQIDARVDSMIENGLEEEVRNLVADYGICDTSAFQAIGYKEIVQYLRGNISLQAAIDEIKLNTRHYAKRQISYYKRMNVAMYIDVDNRSTADIVQIIVDFLNKSGVV